MNKQKLIEENVQDFDFFVSMGNGFVSNGIKAFTGARKHKDEDGFFPTHAGHFRKINGELFIVDAQKDGYNPKPLQAHLNEYDYSFVIYRKNFTPEELIQLEQIEFALIGLEYDFESLVLRHPRKRILEVAEKLSGKDFDEWKERTEEEEKRRLYCSEAEATLLQFENNQVTPFEFQNQLKEEEFVEVLRLI